MFKDLETSLLTATDRILVDDYDLPAILPAWYTITKRNTPVVDFRTNMVLTVDRFDKLCNDILTKKGDTKRDIRLVYEVIENTRLQRMIAIGEIIFTLVYGLGDTDKAREKRNKESELEYGIPMDPDEAIVDSNLVKADKDKSLSVKRKEFKYITRMSIVYSTTEQNIVEKFLHEYDTHKYAELKTKSQNSIFTIGANQSGLMLLRHNMDTKNYKDDILKSNYNDDFNDAYERLTEFLGEKNTSGLVLLKGPPGTGKSSLLIHLTTLAEKLGVRFVFVPSSFTHVLSEPSFLTFAVGNLKNTVLILEDAEEALVSRGTTASSAVTNILNISDGILGKILNLKLIATINREENIDTALKRKGRLRLDYNFGLLKKDKANNLLKKLDIDVTVDKDTSLADIYNIEKDPVVGNDKTIRKPMGFGKK